MSRSDSGRDSLAGKLGANIKRVRLSLKMTQGQLAGEDMTRNMLSLIENGSTLPSLPTLCTIAGKLGLPPGALLGDLDAYLCADLKDELRSLAAREKYAQLIERFEEESIEPDDELALILRGAYINRAYEHFGDGRLSGASEMLAKAASLPQSDADDSLSERVMLLSMLIDENPPDKSARERLAQIIFGKSEYAIYLYARGLLAGASGKAYSVPDENAALYRSKLTPLLDGLGDGFVKRHITAKLEMVAAEYLSAKAMLLPLLELDLPPTLQCELCADLEHCCKCCGDFENAYKYSTKRIELLKKLK